MQENNYSSEQFAYGVLSYLSILCLIPVFMKKEDDFIKFHMKQGLMLLIIEAAAVLIGIIPLLGGLVMMLASLVCGLLSLAGIVQVLMGNKWAMPVISEWAEKFKI